MLSLYFVILYILFIASFFELNGSSKIKVCNGFSIDNLFLIYFSIILCFVLGPSRYYTGRDWKSYIEVYNYCLSDKVYAIDNIETGYLLINRVFKLLDCNYFVLQLFVCSFSSICIIKHFYKNSIFPLFTICLYYINYYLGLDMAQTRQFLAIAILCLGCRFINQKRFISWCFIVFLAMQFHISALFAFPLYFTQTKRITKKTACIILLLETVIIYFGSTFLSLFVMVFSRMTFLPDRLLLLVQRYHHITSTNYSGLGYIVTLVFQIIILIMYDEKHDDYLLNFLIGALFSAMSVTIRDFIRIGYYYMICGCGLMAYNYFGNRNNLIGKKLFARNLMLILFLANSFRFFYSLFFVPGTDGSLLANDYIPYKSFFSNF